MGYIYLITNKINGKQYIGQSLCEDINIRWNRYKNLDKNCIGRRLYNSLIKYGIDSFKFQIICICFNEDCNKYEKEYIKKYNTISPNGYNLMEGGNNSKHHPETIELIRASLKGRITHPITDELRKNISESLKGCKNPNYGKKLTKEQKEKLSNIRKKYWDIQKNQLSKNILNINSLNNLEKGREIIRKKVGKYDRNNNFIEDYKSISEASIKNNISHTSISKVCNNTKGYKIAGGFIWKFL